MIKLGAPLSGKTVALKHVPDPVFAGGLMGPGIGIDPSDEVVLAPFDGTISMLAESKHALTMRHESGLEVLIHIGIDTVGLAGKGFTPFVSEGDQVQAGQKLLGFDSFELIAGGASSLVSVMLVTDKAWKLTHLLGEGVEIKAGHTNVYDAISSEQALAEEAIADDAPTARAEVLIQNPNGLHARPAARFADIANSFVSRIRVEGGKKEANAKSSTALMAANINLGAQIVISAQGPDAEDAVEALVAAVQNGLGEETISAIEARKAGAQVQAPGHQCYKRPVLTEEEVRPIPSGIDTQIKGYAVSEGKLTEGLATRYTRKAHTLAAPTGNAQEELTIVSKLLEDTIAAIEVNIKEARLAGNNTAEEIFDAHLSIISDEDIFDAIKDAIEAGKSAGEAWSEVLLEVAEDLADSDNPLMAERAIDLKDIRHRGLNILYGTRNDILDLALDHNEPFIVVCDELWPSEFALLLERRRFVGFAFVAGSKTSHVSILARAYRVPGIANLGKRIMTIEDGRKLVLDSKESKLVVKAEPRDAAVQRGRATPPAL